MEAFVQGKDQGHRKYAICLFRLFYESLESKSKTESSRCPLNYFLFYAFSFTKREIKDLSKLKAPVDDKKLTRK